MNRIDILLKQDRRLFHTKDLELLWGIENKRTLYSALYRYVQKGILIPIYRGFYSAVPLDKLDRVELGLAALHQFAYLSTESILVKHGLMFQNLPHITFCSGVNRRIQIGNYSIISRQLAAKYLYHQAGIIKQGNYLEATAERAVADILYFNPKYYIDAVDRLDWKKINRLRKELGYI